MAEAEKQRCRGGEGVTTACDSRESHRETHRVRCEVRLPAGPQSGPGAEPAAPAALGSGSVEVSEVASTSVGFSSLPTARSKVPWFI